MLSLQSLIPNIFWNNFLVFFNPSDDLNGPKYIEFESSHFLDDEILGVVDTVNNYGASDILEIHSQLTKNEKLLIPFIRNKFVISIDKSKNVILVDWEEGY